MRENVKIKFTFGLGNALALTISFVKWRSIGWAALHGLCGWFYVIYYLIKYGTGG